MCRLQHALYRAKRPGLTTFAGYAGYAAVHRYGRSAGRRFFARGEGEGKEKRKGTVEIASVGAFSVVRASCHVDLKSNSPAEKREVDRDSMTRAVNYL
jgi:hypothetical protein